MAKMIDRQVYCPICNKVHDLSVPEDAYRRIVEKWNRYNIDDCIKEVAGEVPEHVVRLILVGKCN